MHYWTLNCFWSWVASHLLRLFNCIKASDLVRCISNLFCILINFSSVQGLWDGHKEHINSWKIHNRTCPRTTHSMACTPSRRRPGFKWKELTNPGENSQLKRNINKILIVMNCSQIHRRTWIYIYIMNVSWHGMRIHSLLKTSVARNSRITQ